MKKRMISFFLSLLILSSTAVFQSTANASVNTVRIAGEDFINDAVQISIKGWNSAENVVLANVEDFPDSMAGVTLAALKGGPVLLTGKKSLDLDAAWAISRLKPKNVYLLGGTGALSVDVENKLKSNGYNTIRLAGLDRFKTAVAIGEELIKEGKAASKPIDTAFVAYAHNFPDALSASAIAAKKGWPIVFTETNKLSTDTADALTKWGIKKVFITGGTGVISTKVEDTLKGMGISVERLGGANRYETSVNIVNRFDDGSFKNLFLATGKTFPDALAGSVYAEKMDGPVVLYDKGGASSTTEVHVRKLLEDKKLYVLGREELLPEADIKKLTNSVPFYNSAGVGDTRDAGVFTTPEDKLVTVNRDVPYEVNYSKLNGMIGNTYMITYVPYMTEDGFSKIDITLKYQSETNRYGLEVATWRNTYNTNNAVNGGLNAVLETFYFLCGDKEVAYALWSWFDAKNIDGHANSDDFGFTDIKITSKGAIIKMKNIEIEVISSSGVTTVYFN
jgi:putative cell wall-binding protein